MKICRYHACPCTVAQEVLLRIFSRRSVAAGSNGKPAATFRNHGLGFDSTNQIAMLAPSDNKTHLVDSEDN